jgi:hypothetical protein
MALGSGKYDDIAQEIFDRLKAQGVILLVMKGPRGSGMSCKTDATTLALLPAVLHALASAIESEIAEDLRQIQSSPTNRIR